MCAKLQRTQFNLIQSKALVTVALSSHISGSACIYNAGLYSIPTKIAFSLEYAIYRYVAQKHKTFKGVPRFDE